MLGFVRNLKLKTYNKFLLLIIDKKFLKNGDTKIKYYRVL